MKKRTLLQRITEYFSTSSNPIVNAVRTYTRRWRSSYRTPSNDWGRSDYAFWRRAYWGKAKGLELSGLLIKPMVNKIAAWTLGRAPQWKCENERSQEVLSAWWGDHHSDVLRAWRAAIKQGDSVLVINADLSVTVVQPDLVDPIVADDDYGNVIGWRITQTLQHPDTTARMVVVDEYYADRRVHRVEVDGRRTQETIYPNLIGRSQLVFIANHPEEGEQFGRAEAEALLALFHRYGEVLDAAVEGNVLQGRPTPVITFDTVQDLEKFWDLYGTTERHTLPDGSTESTPSLSVDVTQLLTLSAGTFDYKTPGNFSDDVAKLLEIMFYLFLQHAEIPEFVMGNAISSSKASAETQMPVFEKFIEMYQGEMARWLKQIAEIVLAYQSLIEPGVVAETPGLQWRKLTQDGRLTLDTVTWALEAGLLDDRTALVLAPVEVEDLDEVLEAAAEQRAERQAEATAQLEAQAEIAAANVPKPVKEMLGDVEREAIVLAAAGIIEEAHYGA
jgi:hypothetical protein